MKLVILDRDGVINEDSDAFVKSPEEWKPISGSIEAIARLHREGYHVMIVTNQSGIARGLFDLNVLSKMHNKMLEAVRTAPSDTEAGVPLRICTSSLWAISAGIETAGIGPVWSRPMPPAGRLDP